MLRYREDERNPRREDAMEAYAITRICNLTRDDTPLVRIDMPDPEPSDGQVLVRVKACGVCHTELDEIEGRTPPSFFPMIPGHQVVGVVAGMGKGTRRFAVGDRVGIGWIFQACGTCHWCRRGLENLCPDFMATGRDAHGGYARYMTVHEDFAHPIPPAFSDTEAAPLLCAGAIGLRSLRLARIEDGSRLGLTGFGASAHLVLMTAVHLFPNTRVYVFARSQQEREFALGLGAVWAGDTTDRSPEKLDAVIDTTPAWLPVVEAMANLAPGGRLVINAIRKEHVDTRQLLRIDYPAHLWMEKEVKSVANVTRQDIAEFLDIASRIPLKPSVQTYSLGEANRALADLKKRRIRGAKVLVVD